MGGEFVIYGVMAVMTVGLVAVCVAALAVGMPAVLRSRVRRLAPQGRTECGLKVVDGAVAGLPSGWVSGLADVGPDGWLTFHYYAGGLRAFPRPPVSVRVTGVVDGVPRPPGRGRMFRVAWYTRIVVVATATGTLELAIHPEVLPWFFGLLFAPAAAAPEPVPAAVPGPPSAPPAAPAAPAAAAGQDSADFTRPS